jgi:hypothetical protein
MSYSSENELPEGTSLRRLLDVVELLGYRKVRDGLRVPNRIGGYFWYDENEYKSWSGVELNIFKYNETIKLDTRSTASRSYWDLIHQNRTIKMVRDIFGGNFTSDAG